jgi:TolB-like protein
VIPEDKSSTAQCPICGNVNSSGSIVKGSEKIIEEIFIDKLRDLKNVEIIPQERAAGVYRRVYADSLKKPFSQIIKTVGSELQADVLVAGFVYRYRERVGYDYSTEHPASVTFEIHLISVKNGHTLWRGIYDKEQKSLMEDVFQVSSFFKGGAKWLTARQLTKLGVDEIFKTFPGFGY